MLPNQADTSPDSPIDSLDLQRLMVRAEFIRPLSGMQIVISGRLKRCSHEDAQQLAQRLGGQLQPEVNDQTDLVVIGSGTPDPREKSELQNRPNSVRVVAESEFFGLIVSGEA